MRILHIGALNSAIGNIGVVRQMQSEREVARDLGIEWDVELWAADTLDEFEFVRTYPERCRSRVARRRHFFSTISEHMHRYDLVLLRYVPADPFLPFIKRRAARLALVFHTKDSIALRAQFNVWKGLVFSVADWISCQFVLRKADGLVSVTQDILDYHMRRAFLKDVPSVVVPNGIDLRRFPLVRDHREGKVKLLFVASTFFAWHGLTALLNSLADFRDRDSIELHLIGDVGQSDRRLIDQRKLAGSVRLHGRLDLLQLRHRLEQADVGVASFGLGEAGLREACTLKVREYLAAGVPVYSGHRDVAFPKTFDFYYVGLPDIAAMASFARRMRAVDRVAIRHAAERFIDKKELVVGLHEWALELRDKERV